MKDVRCLFGRHRFSEWVEVGMHLERECLRCSKVEARYPPQIVMLAEVASKVLWKYYMWNTGALKLMNTPSKGKLERDNR